MDRLLALHSQLNPNPTPAEICRNFLLDILKSGKEDVVRWRNPDMLEFEILNESDLRIRFYVRTGRNFRSVLNDGTRFFRKVSGTENIYRFYFIPRHLLSIVPRKTFTHSVRFSAETAV